MILGIGFLLIVSLVASAAIAALRQAVRARVRRLGAGRRSRSTSAISFAVVDGALRDDLQDPAARAHRLARRLDRRGGDGAAVRDRQVADRPLPRAQRRRLGIRRRRLARSSCWSGSTTRRRSSCSAPSSRTSMPTRAERAATPPSQPNARPAARPPAGASRRRWRSSVRANCSPNSSAPAAPRRDRPPGEGDLRCASA